MDTPTDTTDDTTAALDVTLTDVSVQLSDGIPDHDPDFDDVPDEHAAATRDIRTGDASAAPDWPSTRATSGS